MKIPDLKVKMPFKIIWWKDINSDAAWQPMDAAKKSQPTICVSTGWLLLKNKKVTIICSDFNYDESDNATISDVGNVTTIPTCNILSMKDVKI